MNKVYLALIVFVSLTITSNVLAQSSLDAVETKMRVTRIRSNGIERLSFRITNRLNAKPRKGIVCAHTINGLATALGRETGVAVRLRTKRSTARSVVFTGITNAVAPVRGDVERQTKLTVFAEVDCDEGAVALESAPVAKNVTCTDGVSRAVFTSQFKRFVR